MVQRKSGCHDCVTLVIIHERLIYMFIFPLAYFMGYIGGESIHNVS